MTTRDSTDATNSAANHTLSESDVWQLLEEVPDPEIPVVSVVDLGIIQNVECSDGGLVVVEMTPTFAGCPAVEMMKDGIREVLQAAGIEAPVVNVVLDPPWTSDRITDAGRQKMKKFGIAPPQHIRGKDDGANVMLFEAVDCPFCGSKNTRLENTFGPTLCRAMHYCQDCKQPFEQFKPL